MALSYIGANIVFFTLQNGRNPSCEWQRRAPSAACRNNRYPSVIQVRWFNHALLLSFVKSPCNTIWKNHKTLPSEVKGPDVEYPSLTWVQCIAESCNIQSPVTACGVESIFLMFNESFKEISYFCGRG